MGDSNHAPSLRLSRAPQANAVIMVPQADRAAGERRRCAATSDTETPSEDELFAIWLAHLL